MKTIVITGSTRGIGYGLADAFLDRGCRVTISGRTEAVLDQAVQALSAAYDPQRVFGCPCDVTDYEQVQALWDAARARFGPIDIWINNAGIAHAQTDLWAQDPAEIRAVVETNVTGTAYGAQVAIRGMLEQGAGALYNMEGMGSDGRWVEGLTLYGTTKRGVNYMTDALVKETKATPVLVGALQPGMVVTDLLTKQYEDRPVEDWEQAKRIFNILADRVETVTPWMAEKVLENDKTGVRFKYLNTVKIAWRFLAAPLRRRDLFS